MAFQNATETPALEAGTVRNHSITDVQYVAVKSGTLPLAGNVLTIDSTGELVPYDGTTASGVGKANLAGTIDGDGTTDQLLTMGFISVAVLTGETPVLGDTVGVDATAGEVIVGGTFGTFIKEEQTDIWTIRVGW